MILRRVIAHFKKQEWTAIALDFLIVVMGVFIGIQVANWNNARADHATEVTYLILLQRDMRATITDLEEQIEFERFQAQQASKAVTIISQPPSQMRRRKIGMILSQLGTRRTLRIDSPTFQDLQSSGRLGLIADPLLRSEIVTHFFRINRWEAIVDKNNEQFIDNIFNRFLSNYSIGSWSWDDTVMQQSLPSTSINGLKDAHEIIDPHLHETGGANLMLPESDPFWDEVMINLSRRAKISIANVNVSENLLAATQETEAKIAAYLEGRD